MYDEMRPGSGQSSARVIRSAGTIQIHHTSLQDHCKASARRALGRNDTRI